MLIERFRLNSRLRPEECREILRDVLDGEETPRGRVKGPRFRMTLSEYFREDSYTRILYTAYGTIHPDGQGGSLISGWQFQGALDPAWFVGIFFFLLAGLSLLPPSQCLENLARNVQAAFIAYLGVLGSTLFGGWICQVQIGRKLHSHVKEILCEALRAEVL